MKKFHQVLHKMEQKTKQQGAVSALHHIKLYANRYHCPYQISVLLTACP